MRRMILLLLFAACSDSPTGPDPSSPTYLVERVLDGDTIDLAGFGRVRLIGDDCPETFGGVECFGREATTQATMLVEGKRVRVESGPEDVDRFGRKLRYVFREDGLHLNLVLVEGGFCRAEKRFAHPREDEFEAAEDRARSRGLGLWGAC